LKRAASPFPVLSLGIYQITSRFVLSLGIYQITSRFEKSCVPFSCPVGKELRPLFLLFLSCSEDPIEYQLEGISQTQVSAKKGMTFASGLRSVLRQDPDIIMVGEIRDEETAVMAIQSALTGHLVFSTLHTNDAASAVTRLLDLGIEPYLVSSSLISVMAQRLVRKVCAGCSREMVPSADAIRQLGIELEWSSQRRICHGLGCEACRHTGYRGRIGIFELLIVDDAVRERIQGHSNASMIRDVAVRNGMKLLREDGLAKTLAGITTIDEVVRVTMRTAL
jgi:general secretion pathway protein E